MLTHKFAFITLAMPLLLLACASPPMGPTVQVMPNPNKRFQVFQQDQYQCKQYATGKISGQADGANTSAVGRAALGALLGIGLGAAIGDHRGASIGAASGVIAGTSNGAASSQNAQRSIQEQYNNAFVQCT